MLTRAGGLGPLWLWLCLADSDHGSPTPSAQIPKNLLAGSAVLRDPGTEASLQVTSVRVSGQSKHSEHNMSKPGVAHQVASPLNKHLAKLSSNRHKQGPLSQKLQGFSAPLFFFSQLSQALDPKNPFTRAQLYTE